MQNHWILDKSTLEFKMDSIHTHISAAGATSLLAQALAKNVPRRPRGEKKPIPDNQKDNRYFERRRRNNLAGNALHLEFLMDDLTSS